MVLGHLVFEQSWTFPDIGYKMTFSTRYLPSLYVTVPSSNRVQSVWIAATNILCLKLDFSQRESCSVGSIIQIADCKCNTVKIYTRHVKRVS